MLTGGIRQEEVSTANSEVPCSLKIPFSPMSSPKYCIVKHHTSSQVPAGDSGLKTPKCVTVILKLIYYSSFPVQSCIIVSLRSTHHLLLIKCKCKRSSSFSVTTSNASEAKLMIFQRATLPLWARASVMITIQHQ